MEVQAWLHTNFITSRCCCWQETIMALEIVSCFFDGYRKNGKEGENALKLVRENISNSIKSSSLGNNSL